MPRKGQHLSEAARKKLSNFFTGRKLTQEHRDKVSKGVKSSTYYIAKYNSLLEIHKRGFKLCPSCNIYRPLTMFGKHKGHQFDLTRLCKICKNLLEICKKHKLRLTELTDLYRKYKNQCGICDRKQSEFTENLAIDHDHITGRIRGLLCSNCNTGLGQFKDNIKLLEKAMIYLQGDMK